ncbi:glutathione S-transferase N-terminal domain-containing protein [uncultured Bartonella sp.]|uniref:glutathione S-transferase N-terminal domain-containing protein n=1 Tax=uncultured Bartonella sp. TaxID=104108 RepID=UPI002606CA32|nr:glutathione S-transferase N-terminal domain-containing protein [uncultured Bartonella sp.]
MKKPVLRRHYLGIPFEEIAVDTTHDREELTRYNPLGKIPAFINDEAEVFLR